MNESSEIILGADLDISQPLESNYLAGITLNWSQVPHK